MGGPGVLLAFVLAVNVNPIIRYFADGSAFFVGAAVLLVGPLLERLPVRGRGWKAGVLRMALLLAVAVVVLSGTPLPIWLCGLWAAALVMWTLAHASVLKLRRGGVWTCRVLASVLAAGVLAWEAPHQFNPAIPWIASQPVYVIGDSISSGLELDQAGAWPDLLARRTGGRVVNLAQPGAKIGAGAYQAEGVREANALVLIEMGGNDLLLTPAADFEADLDRLLQAVSGPERRVVVLELPSLPLGNLYLLAQRRQAGRHGAALVPRRLLVDVWAAPGATLDGVHLSPAGHERLAEGVAELLAASRRHAAE
jgi:lysophospholipase L1-like esterase